MVVYSIKHSTMENQTFQNPLRPANTLINETSPYLLQHAYNPVNWHGWNAETLEKARLEDKMLLVSIGYSACHWCHVMEHESFENEEIANIMNRHFICIKVDREERPDVDALYMQAVQLIHGGGGWPLNCFALPDGKPFYGGTYFRPTAWKELLESIAGLYNNQREALEKQAENILEGLKNDVFIGNLTLQKKLDGSVAVKAHEKISKSFDRINGGLNGAPKFPMPNNLQFLTMFSILKNKPETIDFVGFTLDKMASGGIYDHLAGGFSRYSVDAAWKVPHFEKMLYDNAQLISLYSYFYLLTGSERHLQTAIDSAGFVLSELTSPQGYFYSALDADSEGEEGKFYLWTKNEISRVLKSNSDLILEYFGVDNEALWENGKNILVKTDDSVAFTKRKGIAPADFQLMLNNAKSALLAYRNTRIRPGLDDKSLTSWNSLMISALCHLFVSTENEKYYQASRKATDHILSNLMDENGTLFHSYKQQANIPGFLEDYALFAEALLNLYETCFDEKWLFKSLELCEIALKRFYDKTDGYFWFTSNENHDLVARKKEITEGVIPSSNSTMAKVLFILGRIFGRRDFVEISEKMMSGITENIAIYPSAFSNWGIVMLFQTENFYEIVITGKDSKQKASEILRHPYPAKFVLAADEKSSLTAFSNRFAERKSLIYVCSGNECKMPVESVIDATKLLVS